MQQSWIVSAATHFTNTHDVTTTMFVTGAWRRHASAKRTGAETSARARDVRETLTVRTRAFVTQPHTLATATPDGPVSASHK